MGIVLADQNNCTGCGACLNICPKNAIKMMPDEEGFIQPKIDETLCVECEMCEKACPVLHPQYKNDVVDSCYAMWAQDDMRSITSTAGFFLLLAQKTIQEKGVVYGAAWANDWHVHHIGVEKIEDLHLLCGSKYLQSDAEESYRSVEKELKAGRKVLFSGCPCQIAGLYGYLHNKEYENLTTIEIICHGVPSPKAFHKYLNDNFDVSEIDQINFRDKTAFGWSTTANIYFKDKQVYRKNERLDPFYKAFLPCMILRRSCEVCQFSRLPRQADISVGDFWGIADSDRSWDDRKGTEVVLLNNHKGKDLFEQLIPKMKRYEEFPLEAATKINKTILHPFRAHPGRKHFFSSMDIKPFNELVDASLEHQYDIGVVGLWYGINYGSVLTYYALYSLLRDMGYDPVMLPKPNNLWEERFNDPNSIAQRFIWKHCNVFVPFNVQEEYLRVNDLCKDFIVGSDVVWNYDVCGKQSDQFFFLDWVEAGHKKIAYAASFGNGLEGTSAYVEKAKYNLKRFNSIAVRESSGVQAARRDCQREDIQHVLDPVFVCNPAIYDAAIAEAGVKETVPTVFAYILRKSMAEKKMELIDYACSHFKAEARICGNPNEMESSRALYGDKLMPELSIEEWLYHMKHCEFYIGDSYHALCFSLLFHKPFIIIYGKADYSFSGARFLSLLKIVGLEDRLVETLDDFEACKKLVQKPIDWEQVDARLDAMREPSFKWLENALKEKVKEPTAEEYCRDAQLRKISEYGVQIFEQSRKIDSLCDELRNEILEVKKSREITELKDKVFGMESTVNRIDDKTEQLYNSSFGRGWRNICRIYHKIRGV